jgi:hypothetical protein
VEKSFAEFFHNSERYRADRTHRKRLIFPIVLHYIQTRIAVKFALWVLIELFDAIALLMKAVIAQVAVDDLVFSADVGRKTDFAVGFESVAELGFC